jgi:peptidylamidoglycolate lyase
LTRAAPQSIVTFMATKSHRHAAVAILLASCLLAHAHDTHPDRLNYKSPDEPIVIGEGKFKYQLVPGWSQHNTAKYKIGNGKAIVEDAKGRIYHLNGSAKNCVIVLNRKGDVLKAWGDFAPGAHGLNILKEGNREVLFISENRANGKIFKTTLDGEILLTVSCPTESGLYPDPGKFRPAEVVLLPNGDFFALDGYGSDYILRFNKAGKYLSAFGGNLGEGEAQLKHWGPHGANIDYRDPKNPVLIIGLSDQEKIKRFKLDGTHIDTIPMPGANPRDIYFHRGHIYIPHLGDNWPKERNNPGYISVVDYDFKVVANLGAYSASYQVGKLERMHHNQHAFHHPHGILLSKDGSLYVVQDASNNTWPMKFVPVE